MLAQLIRGSLGYLIEGLEKNEISWELVAGPSALMLLFTGILAIPFILTWRSIRKAEKIDDSFLNGELNFNINFLMYRATKFSVMISAVTLVPIILIVLEKLDSFSVEMNKLTIIAFFIGFSGLMLSPTLIIWGFVRSIIDYGFFAPIGYIFILTVMTVYIVNIFIMIFGIISIIFDGNFRILVFSPAWFLIASCFMFVLRNRDLQIKDLQFNDELNTRFATLVIFNAIMIYKIDLDFLHDYLYVFLQPLEFVLGLLMAFIVPYTIAIYAVVYSNSVPDWLSIALNRFLLHRASKTQKMKDFFVFLLYDLLCAIGLCVATLLILVIAFSLSGIFVSIFHKYIYTGFFFDALQLERVANFFLDAPYVVVFLIERLVALREGDMEAFFGRPVSPGPGAIVLLAVLGLTSLIPTLLNACTMLCLIAARGVALVVVPPMRLMHSLLVITEDTPNEDKRKARDLSAALIGTISAAALCITYLLYWLARHGAQ
jgi:hypothetical protein